MRRQRKYENDSDEYLHPFWLGLLMLFTVTTVIGTICFIRKKCRSNLRYLFNCLRCEHQSHTDNHSKIQRQSFTSSSYNWQPTFVPPRPLSPKLMKLARHSRLTSFDKRISIPWTDNQDDLIENDVFTITDESDFVRHSISHHQQRRHSETARNFFANMRNIHDYRKSASIDSSNAGSFVAHALGYPSKKFTKQRSIKLFHTPHFFHGQ